MSADMVSVLSIQWSEVNTFLLVVLLVGGTCTAFGALVMLWRLVGMFQALVADFGRFLDYQAEFMRDHSLEHPSHRPRKETVT